ncbi:MAG: hypothetical protein IJ566_07595 [Cardiobacteriaceae bacterium]|nr:hypothetical protein [Cardiobacteriaceae bacterium]
MLHEFKFNPIAGGLLLYPILGYVIANIEIKRCYRVCIYILGIFALLLHCVGTIYLSPEYGINRLFKGYVNFPCVFYSVSVFLFCKCTDWSFLSKDDCLTAFFIKFIKQNSLGVYLIHGYFVYYIVPYLHIDNRSIFYRTIGALLIVFICAFISHLIRKIPIVKRSLG